MSFTDSVLTTQQTQEQLSTAYVHAVAARAGYTVTKPVPDMAGIDLHIQAGEPLSPQLDLQLKATVGVQWTGSDFSFPLDVGGYEKLRSPCVNPRILVVYLMPNDQNDWLHVGDDYMQLRHCAYWVSLAGAAAVTNTTSITVTIPTSQTFDVSSLRDIMAKIRNGVPL